MGYGWREGGIENDTYNNTISNLVYVCTYNSIPSTVNSPPVLYSQFISREVPPKHNSGLDAVSSSIRIINHTLLSTIRAVIGTLTCMSMASNSTSDSECY